MEVIFGDIVARKIKDEYSETRTILISAYSPDDVQLKELEESKCITKFVKKPVDMKSLVEIVADAIN